MAKSTRRALKDFLNSRATSATTNTSAKKDGVCQTSPLFQKEKRPERERSDGPTPPAGPKKKKARKETRNRLFPTTPTVQELESDWTTIMKKKGRAQKSVEESSKLPARKKDIGTPKWRSLRPDVVVVKAKEGGLSYAEILGQMKSDPTLKEAGENVTKIRRNAAGNLLLGLKRTAVSTRVAEAISASLGDAACVETRCDETLIEIRDLDEFSTKEDVCNAIGRDLEVNVDAAAVKSMRKAYGSTQTAVVRLPMILARKAVENGRVRIGWVNCRIRRKIDVRKCFRCWTFGHFARDCKGPDRSECCLRCGETGHMRLACKRSEPRCVLCKDRTNHITGSFGCPAYQAAIRRKHEGPPT